MQHGRHNGSAPSSSPTIDFFRLILRPPHFSPFFLGPLAASSPRTFALDVSLFLRDGSLRFNLYPFVFFFVFIFVSSFFFFGDSCSMLYTVNASSIPFRAARIESYPIKRIPRLDLDADDYARQRLRLPILRGSRCFVVKIQFALSERATLETSLGNRKSLHSVNFPFTCNISAFQLSASLFGPRPVRFPFLHPLAHAAYASLRSNSPIILQNETADSRERSRCFAPPLHSGTTRD